VTLERSLVSREPRIPPCRGIVAAHNRHGIAYGALHVRRWLRYTRLVHKADKVDLLAHGPHTAAFFDVLPTSDEFKLRLEGVQSTSDLSREEMESSVRMPSADDVLNLEDGAFDIDEEALAKYPPTDFKQIESEPYLDF